MNKLTIDNFGENSFMAFRESDKNISNLGQIDHMVYHPFSGSKISNEFLTLNDDLLTKFYITSISFLGLYVFHTLLFQKK